jgi:hypothetical protein
MLSKTDVCAWILGKGAKRPRCIPQNRRAAFGRNLVHPTDEKYYAGCIKDIEDKCHVNDKRTEIKWKDIWTNMVIGWWLNSKRMADILG